MGNFTFSKESLFFLKSDFWDVSFQASLTSLRILIFASLHNKTTDNEMYHFFFCASHVTVTCELDELFHYWRSGLIYFFPGIDLAFIENGFIYHTKYDTANRILTDSIQRAGKQRTSFASMLKYLLRFYSRLIANM